MITIVLDDMVAVKRGDLFNGTYSLGQMTDDRIRYSGQKVV